MKIRLEKTINAVTCPTKINQWNHLCFSLAIILHGNIHTDS